MQRYLMMIFLCLATQLAFAAEKVTVILDWFVNPNHAPLVIAKEKGFFKDEGLDVTLIGPADPTDPPKFVAAGRADIGITYEPQFMEQVDRGLPLIRIGTLIDQPLDCLIVLKDSGIRSLTDLKGKRIGHGSGGLSSIMLKTVLQHAGLAENDIELINVKYNLTQALLTHRVDAVSGIMRNVEISEIEALGHKVVPFLPEDNGIPTYSSLIFITQLARAHDARWPKFMAAVKHAVRYIDEHPQQSWNIFAKANPEANNPVNHDSWFATMPYFAEDPAAFNQDEWRKFAIFMLNHHMINNIQPLSRYAYTPTKG